MKGAMKMATKGARAALGSAASMPAMPEMPQRPKPMLSLELSDIDGGEGIQMGETLTLTVTGKVTSMDEEEYGDDKALHTHVRLRLSKIARAGEAMTEQEPAEEDMV